MLEREIEAGDVPKQKVVSHVPGLEIDVIPEFEEIPVDKELNLKGKVCPYTFVESMLALEDMEIGQVLRVIVDYEPSACDVPRSLAREGYEILAVGKINETDWTIDVRNKEFE
jgi:tRNA 2-thiouridine synthesizing protein A